MNQNDFAPVQNPCKLCAPLGASLVFRGLERTIGVLHGSQGCATYIRRYLISHFKEPVDIASSSFSEDTAIYGGAENLKTALDNVILQYQPRLIGVASTCLSETIGEDVGKVLKEYQEARRHQALPELVHVATPSYKGSHMDGFHAAVLALVRRLSGTARHSLKAVNVFPGMVSPEDLRYLKRTLRDFGLEPIVLPDYSQTLDGPAWEEYQILPEGGTPLETIRGMAASRASLEFGTTLNDLGSASAELEKLGGVIPYRMDLPIGLFNADRFYQVLEKISGHPLPEDYLDARGRLLDAYADGHKQAFGVRVGIFGEEDWVISLASFAREIGMIPVLCGSGGASGRLQTRLTAHIPDIARLGTVVLDNADFAAIAAAAGKLRPELLVGHSKGHRLARDLGIPLVRVGFPIHDRIGGQRLLHLGYHGTLRLFDQIINTIIAGKQNNSEVGYSYM